MTLRKILPQFRPLTTLSHHHHYPHYPHLAQQLPIPLSINHTLYNSKNFTDFTNSTSSNGPSNDHNRQTRSKVSKDQTRKANIGKMIEYLRSIIPDALHTTPDSKYLNQDIILRVSPTVTKTNQLPLLKGRGSYLTTLRATQFILVNFLLNWRVKLHILDIKTCLHSSHNNNNNLNETFDSNLGKDGKVHNNDINNNNGVDIDNKNLKKYGLYEHTDKIIIKWRTCLDDCDHLINKTSYAKQGSHILGKFDISKIWGGNNDNGRNGNNKDNNGLIDGVSKNEGDDFERIFYGIFVFELNENCDEIIVHSLENLEIFDKKNYCNDGGLGNIATN